AFAERGGQIFIAAGAGFDPTAWTRSAWLEGRGILPAPLKPAAAGRLPGEAAGDLEPFAIDVASLASEVLLLPGVAREEVEDLYRLPLFFKAVEADVAAASQVAPGAAPAEPPRVLARLTNGLPLVVERALGRGRAVLLATGLEGGWSTLAKTNAVVLLDRLLRSLLERSLPRRNLEPVEEVHLEVDAAERRAVFTLTRPGGEVNPLPAGALGAEAYGVTLTDLTRRGAYRVRAEREGSAGGPGARLWEEVFAVNGPASESELASIDAAGLAERARGASVRWVPRGEPIPLDGAASLAGAGLWRWLLVSVLALLAVEMALLAWLAARRRAAADRAAALEVSP
ncbi:MAG: hypothetical protein HY721_20350, partial [Planctomycetes bacterium]|nr:hypothetical protein [Planctomycetota bacterium]